MDTIPRKKQQQQQQESKSLVLLASSTKDIKLFPLSSTFHLKVIFCH